MLLCVDYVHITGWHVFHLLCVFLWNFYRKLNQVQTGVHLAFFKLMEEFLVIFLTQTLYSKNDICKKKYILSI